MCCDGRGRLTNGRCRDQHLRAARSGRRLDGILQRRAVCMMAPHRCTLSDGGRRAGAGSCAVQCSAAPLRARAWPPASIPAGPHGQRCPPAGRQALKRTARCSSTTTAPARTAPAGLQAAGCHTEAGAAACMHAPMHACMHARTTSALVVPTRDPLMLCFRSSVHLRVGTREGGRGKRGFHRHTYAPRAVVVAGGHWALGTGHHHAMHAVCGRSQQPAARRGVGRMAVNVARGPS